MNIECSQSSPTRYHAVSHIVQSQIGTVSGMFPVLHPGPELVTAWATARHPRPAFSVCQVCSGTSTNLSSAAAGRRSSVSASTRDDDKGAQPASASRNWPAVDTGNSSSYVTPKVLTSPSPVFRRAQIVKTIRAHSLLSCGRGHRRKNGFTHWTYFTQLDADVCCLTAVCSQIILVLFPVRASSLGGSECHRAPFQTFQPTSATGGSTPAALCSLA